MFGKLLRYFAPESIPGFAVELYDEVARTVKDIYYRRVALEIVAFIDHGKLLDLGTGPGYLPIEIVKLAPCIRIDAVDSSKKMIEKARRNAAEAGVSNEIDFHLGNANKLRVANSTYDMIVSTGAFHAWKRPERVIAECYRVLKPGKDVWIYDPAQISTEKTLKLCQEQNKSGWGRIACKWASSTASTSGRTVSQTHEMLSRTSFTNYQIEHRQGEIKITLKKDWGGIER